MVCLQDYWGWVYGFWMNAGETIMMRSVEGEGLCEKALHGGGCKDAECASGCKHVFGAGAMGLCFFFRTPSDTCLCRYPCWSLQLLTIEIKWNN